MDITLDRKHYDYCRFSKIKPFTPFNEIEIGVMYHIPPTIIYPRRDFLVKSKTTSTVSGLAKIDGKWENLTLYQSELSMRFLVKKQTIGKK